MPDLFHITRDELIRLLHQRSQGIVHHLAQREVLFFFTPRSLTRDDIALLERPNLPDAIVGHQSGPAEDPYPTANDRSQTAPTR